MNINSDFVVRIYLLCLPLVCFVAKFFTAIPGKIFFDVVTIFFIIQGLFLLPFGGMRFFKISRPPLYLFLGLLFLMLLKSFFEVFYFGTEFYWVPFLREIKPVLYFLFAFLVIGRFGAPSFTSFDLLGKVFALLVLLDFLIGTLLIGVPYRPFVCDEPNYDNFVILLGYLAHLSRIGIRFNSSFFIYFLATLASQSKTGVITFLILTILVSLRFSSIKSIFYVITGFFAAFGIWALRLSSIKSIDEIDRVRMWLSYLDLVKESSVARFFFGFMPGVPLRHDDPYLGWFIWYQVEQQLGAAGLHAFNFHSMWLRLLATYGAIGTFVLFVLLLYWIPLNRVGFALLIFISLQGLSMGVFYLSTVAPILLIFLASATNEAHSQRDFVLGESNTLNKGRRFAILWKRGLLADG